MAVGVDGDIVMEVGLDPKNAIAGAESLREKVQSTLNQVNGQKLSKEMTKFTNKTVNATTKVSSLSTKLQKLLDMKAAGNPATEKLQKELDGVKQKAELAKEEMDALISKRMKSVKNFPWAKNLGTEGLRNWAENNLLNGSVNTGKLANDRKLAQQLAIALEDSKNKAAELQEQINIKNESFLADLDKQIQDTAMEIQTKAPIIEQGLEDIQRQANSEGIKVDTGIEIDKPSSDIERLKESVDSTNKRVGNLIQSLIKLGQQSVKNGIAKIKENISGLGKDSENAGNSVKKLLRTFIKYGFGVRSFFFLWRKLRTAIKDGFTDMASLNGGVNRVAETLNGLKDSLLYLRNSWVAAFEPILQFVAPAVNYLLGLLANLANMIGNFFAVLTGKKLMKAVKQQTALGAAVDKTAGGLGDAAENAEKASHDLAEFDDLDVLKQPDDSSGSGAGGGGGGVGDIGGLGEDMWEEVDAVSPLAERLKEYLSDIWSVFKQSWELNGATTIENAKATLNSIGTLLGDIANTFRDVWTSGTGLEFLNSVFNLTNTILDIVRAISDAIDTAWNRDENGYAWIESIINKFTAILNLLTTIGDSIARVFNSPIAVEIFSNILQIFTHINNIVTNLANRFREAWESAGLGDEIITKIAEIINIIATSINNIVSSMEQWAASIDFEPILQSVSGTLDVIKGIVESISSGAEWLWENILKPLATWTIEESGPAALDMIANAINLISTVSEAVARDLGNLWTNFLEPVSNFVGGAITALFETLAQVFKDIADSEVAVSILADVVLQIGAMAGGLLLLTKGVAAVTAIMGILSNPITLIIAAIAGLVIVIAEVTKHWDEWKAKIVEFIGAGENLMNGFFSGILNVVKGIKKWIKDNIVDPFLKGIKSLFGIASPSKKMISIGNYVMQGMLKGVSEKIGDVGKLFKKIWTNITDVFTNTENWFGTKFEGARDAILIKWKDIKSNFKDKWNDIKNAFTEGADGIGSWFKDKFSNAHDAAVNAWGTVKSNFSTIWGNVQKGFTEGVNGIGNWFKDTFGTALKDATGAWNDVKSSFSTIWGNIQKGFTEGADGIGNWFSTTFENAKKNAVSAWSDVKSKFKGVSDNIKDAFSGILDSLGLGSPTVNTDYSSQIWQIRKQFEGSLNGVYAGKVTVGVPSFTFKKGATAGNFEAVTERISMLARGAVIPPNSEFLAVLGDQKQGVNIESPLSTMVDAFRTAAEDMLISGGYGNNNYAEMTLDGQTFARLIVPYVISELNRKGYNTRVLEE